MRRRVGVVGTSRSIRCRCRCLCIIFPCALLHCIFFPVLLSSSCSLVTLDTLRLLHNTDIDTERDVPTTSTRRRTQCDSLDTLLYVRFAFQNLEFYEWKLGDRQWALTWHRTHTLLALWPGFTYEKTEREEVFSFMSYSLFKNLQFLQWNLQFHCKYVYLWEGFSEHCGFSPLRGPSAWAISGLQPSSLGGERRSVG